MANRPFTFFNPDARVERSLGGNLPHWQQAGVLYFTTFRLGDSLPKEKLDAWKRKREQWLNLHPLPHDEATLAEYHRQFTAVFHRWLDAGYGSCILANPQARDIVAETLLHFANQRYWLGRFVIMPNHVHALVAPLAGHTLDQVLQTWKSYTAHEINKALGKHGTVWQKEPYDHIVRSSAQWAHFERYIEENPAKLRPGAFALGGEFAPKK